MSRAIIGVLCLALTGCVRTITMFEPSTEPLTSSPPIPSAIASLTFFLGDWRPASKDQTEDQLELILGSLRASGVFTSVGTTDSIANPNYELRFRWHYAEHATWAYLGFPYLFLPLEAGYASIHGQLAVYDSSGVQLAKCSAEAEWKLYFNFFHLLSLGPDHTISRQRKRTVDLLITELLRQALAAGVLSRPSP
jgi:hypothetical protein